MILLELHPLSHMACMGMRLVDLYDDIHIYGLGHAIR